MDELSKLLAKKKDKKVLNPDYKKAKMSVLGDLHKQMGDMIGGDVQSLKKVTVAAPDKSKLLEGLEKAEEIVAEQAPDEEPELKEEVVDLENMSIDELEEKIKELEEVKKLKMLKG